jgi:ribosome-associated inhibitor A
MLINVTGRQFEITPAIQTQAETVLSSLDIPALKVSSVNVVMSREKNHFQVSLVLNCKYHTLKAEVEDFDLYRALDAAADKVEAQCLALKEKIQDHRSVPVEEDGSAQNVEQDV